MLNSKRNVILSLLQSFATNISSCLNSKVGGAISKLCSNSIAMTLNIAPVLVGQESHGS